MMTDEGSELREGYAEIGDQRLHQGWRWLLIVLGQLPELLVRLAAADQTAGGGGISASSHPTRAVTALSSKPKGVDAYSTDLPADDIRGLIEERGAESALLVGHDWGGTIAWTTAMNHPEVVDRLAILNAAHPRQLSQGLHHPGQLRKSWYFFFFDLPELPESVVHADRLALLPALPARRPPGLHAGGDRPLRRGVVAARRSRPG